MAELESRPGPSDPIASLHKMSTTAGVSNEDYVAINLTGVTAALLGVAAFLAVMSDLLLIIPLAGVIFAVVAWRQIGRSGGTQTGRWLAVGGLLLSLAAGSITLLLNYREAVANRDEQRQIDIVIGQLDAAVKQGGGALDGAYDQLFSKKFKDHVTLKEFQTRWHDFQIPEHFGPVQEIKGNGQVALSPAQEGTGRIASSMLLIRFQKTVAGDYDRFGVAFEKPASGGPWQIAFLEMFPVKQPGN